ncbi:ABC transporter ATP-binding protein [Chelatococcus reniformis]|uniref:ABC transporter ATP-binding protein n=1 Tax=Chelatococcus reniformis TaxID=1494448 RepID=UPI00166384BE|nr:ABC transporter ATP-binding protein [Chelatococcus reniformis]
MTSGASRSAATPLAAPAAISLIGVGKSYPSGTQALDGLDLVVRQGEFLALLGPSGCGKSTALRIMAGLAAPSSGTVERHIGAADGASIGFVFQEPTLMPWARVAANVRLPLDLAGVGRAEARRRAEEMIERVGLAGFGRAYPRELSGGMRMRVSLARALVTRPHLLLMDEPFAALDEITRFRLNDDLLALRAAFGCTIAFVTHSTYESVYLADRIVVMSGRPGRVTDEIVVEAPGPRTAAFRGTAGYAEQCRRAFAAVAGAAAASEPR